MDRRSRYAEYVPVVLIVVGFAFMFLGWNGAASRDCVQCQVPYMISGGLIGLGLVFFGSASLVVRAFKEGLVRQLKELESLTETNKRVATTLTWSANGTGANGHQSNELVVVGASSFHLVDCRLVKSRESLEKVPKEQAVESGLEACRVCKP